MREPASAEDISGLAEMLQVIEPEITTDDVSSGVKMEKWPHLKEWIDQHCRLGHYMIQVQ